MSNTYGYPPVEQQHCGICRYAVELPKRDFDDVVRCARHAPVILPEPLDPEDPTLYGYWPAVLPDCWCGEWAPKDGGVG